MLSGFVFVLIIGLALAADKGIVELDDVTFKKLVGGQHHVVVVFTEFSWKLPEQFGEVGEAFADNADVLVAKVDTSSVADGSALKVADLPTIRFYAKGSDAPSAVFTGDADDSASVIDFVNSQLSPELQQLKGMAEKFIHGAEDARKTIIESAEKVAGSLAQAYARTGKFFTVFMKRIVEKGDQWVDTEHKRLQGLIGSTSVTSEKKKDFKQRLGVLQAFKKKTEL